MTQLNDRLTVLSQLSTFDRARVAYAAVQAWIREPLGVALLLVATTAIAITGAAPPGLPWRIVILVAVVAGPAITVFSIAAGAIGSPARTWALRHRGAVALVVASRRVPRNVDADVHLGMLSSWPRGGRAGRELGRQLLDDLDGQGAVVSLTCRRRMLPTYADQGFEHTGKTWWGMQRMLRQPARRPAA